MFELYNEIITKFTGILVLNIIFYGSGFWLGYFYRKNKEKKDA